MGKRYHIKHISTYQGESDYEVFDRTEKETFRIQYRFMIPEYEEENWNYTPEDFNREIAGSAFFVTRSLKKITPDLVEAFRNHLQIDHNEYLKYCAEKIAKFGDDVELCSIYDSYGPASPLLLGGAYWEKGWHKI